MRQWIVVLALVAGCGQEYQLSDRTDPVAPLPPGVHEGRQSVEAPAVHAPVSGSDPSTAPPRTVEVVLGGGAAAAAVDYLFVVDSSASMKSVIDSVFSGVDAIAAEGNVFPKNARIAVMGTTPSNPRDLTRPHRAAPKAAFVSLDPGFHGPIDARRIAEFRKNAPPEIAAGYELDGCVAWFAPGDVNATGVPCLVAHTQTLLFPVVVEAGLTALGQRLSEDEPLFRNGAAVNVIFVSDTHDPGVSASSAFYDELVAIRPNYQALSALANANHNLSSFRVHAIAPAVDCSSEKWTDPVYFDAADASGGEKLDVCTATPEDYVAMIRGMVTGGAVPQRGVIALDERADVAEVLVDGHPVGSRLSSDRRAVLLDVLPSARSSVAVRYR